jgi:prepilin-type N-terminal cleavage/methylation domain-containing protein
MRKYSEKGFTLIELLIVIVIIGILAGVLIALIDPAQQQNRARDAGVKAAMNKVVLSVQGYISAYGHAPDALRFAGSLDNITIFGTCAAAANTCLFSVTGNPLPSSCATADWTGEGTGACYYRYARNTAAGSESQFLLGAKSFGVQDTVFVYRNYGATGGEIVHCSPANAACGNF